jgi:hypothetical protein
LAPTTSPTNVLSLGAGIDTESLEFTKSGNNLILTDGVAGDSITFTNWYAGSSDQDYVTLQVIELASANYNSGGGDPLRDKPIEAFNLTTLVSEYNAAGSPANWALSNGMPSAALATSASADYGGDLSYYFGLNGNLTGVDLSDVPSVLTNSSFGTGTQAINSFSSISGGGGLHLLVKPPGAEPPIATPTTSTGTHGSGSDMGLGGVSPSAPISVTPTDPALPRRSPPVLTAPIEAAPADPFSYLKTRRATHRRSRSGDFRYRISRRFRIRGDASTRVLDWRILPHWRAGRRICPRPFRARMCPARFPRSTMSIQSAWHGPRCTAGSIRSLSSG